MPVKGEILHGRYRIEEFIAQRGECAVYRAIDQSTGLECAIRQTPDSGPAAQDHFWRQVNLLAGATRPGVPHLVDCFQIPGESLVLVVSIGEGQNLALLLDDTWLDSAILPAALGGLSAQESALPVPQFTVTERRRGSWAPLLVIMFILLGASGAWGAWQLWSKGDALMAVVIPPTETATATLTPTRTITLTPSPSRTPLPTATATITLTPFPVVEKAWLENLHDDYFLDLATSSTGLLAGGTLFGKVHIYEQATHKPVRTIQVDGVYFYSVAFSPDGRHLAAGANDGTIRLYETESYLLVWKIQAGEREIYDLAFSPGGDRIASGSGDNTVRLWDANSGKQLASARGHASVVLNVVYSPDGTLLATAGDDLLRLRRASDLAPDLTLGGTDDPVRFAAFSPDGQWLVTLSTKHVNLWKVSNGHLEYDFSGNGFEDYLESMPTRAVFSPDGEMLAVGWEDKQVTIYDVPTRLARAVLEDTGSVNGLVFSNDSQFVFAADWGGILQAWKVK